MRLERLGHDDELESLNLKISGIPDPVFAMNSWSYVILLKRAYVQIVLKFNVEPMSWGLGLGLLLRLP